MKKTIGKEFFDLTNDISDLMYNTELMHKSILKLGKVEANYLQFLLAEDKPINMKDLGEHLKVSQSRITHLTDSLIKKGYVDRYASTEDRRVNFAFITEKGKELLNKNSNECIKIYTKLLSKLPEDKIDSNLESLTIWRDFLAQYLKETKA